MEWGHWWATVELYIEKNPQHFTKAIKRAILLGSFGVNKSTLTPLSDLFALNDSFAFICLIPERLLCCSILTQSIGLFFKAKWCGFESGSVDAGLQQSWNPLHKLKELAILYCLYHACLLKEHQPFSSGKWVAWGTGGIPEALCGPLGIPVRCACKSSGGCFYSRCEHFLNSFHKPLQDYSLIVLNWKAKRVCSADPPTTSRTALMLQDWMARFWLGWRPLPFLPTCSCCFSCPITSPHLDQVAQPRDSKEYKVSRFLSI